MIVRIQIILNAYINSFQLTIIHRYHKYLSIILLLHSMAKISSQQDSLQMFNQLEFTLIQLLLYLQTKYKQHGIWEFHLYRLHQHLLLVSKMHHQKFSTMHWYLKILPIHFLLFKAHRVCNVRLQEDATIKYNLQDFQLFLARIKIIITYLSVKINVFTKSSYQILLLLHVCFLQCQLNIPIKTF